MALDLERYVGPESTRGGIGVGSYILGNHRHSGWSVAQQTAFGHIGHTDWPVANTVDDEPANSPNCQHFLSSLSCEDFLQKHLRAPRSV